MKRCLLVALLVPAPAPVDADGSAAGPPQFPAEMRDTSALMSPHWPTLAVWWWR